MEVSIDFKDTLLKELVKNLSTKKKIQIGIFGDSGLAEVAQKMEYGANNQYVKQIDKTLNVPPRSFLEVPISDNLEKEIRLDDENKIIHEGIDYVAEQVKQFYQNLLNYVISPSHSYTAFTYANKTFVSPYRIIPLHLPLVIVVPLSKYCHYFRQFADHILSFNIQ